MTDQIRTTRRNADVDRRIDDNLKRAFQRIENEPMPDRFKDLLSQLKSSDGCAGGSQTND
ncbi:MAG: NepR family anti-sigma factor [Paracoccaceae bacterium]